MRTCLNRHKISLTFSKNVVQINGKVKEEEERKEKTEKKIKTSRGYLKNNFVSSECQIMRKSSQRDAIDALVDEEILEEEAVQDVLRENEENQGEGERHKSKLREELCINTRIEDQSGH